MAKAAVVASAEHVRYCFDALSSHFTGDPQQAPTFENVLGPLFVTWNKEAPGGELRLRGCIGTLEPRHLHKALKDYALTSALRDRRFAPIAWEELAVLHCTVSLLHTFESGLGWSSWTVGVHGVIIYFQDPGTRTQRSATYLPEVPLHEGWPVQQAIDSLVRKAGYHGPVTSQLRSSIRLTRYQSTACSMSYSDWLRARTRGLPSGEPNTVDAASIQIVVPA